MREPSQLAAFELSLRAEAARRSPRFEDEPSTADDAASLAPLDGHIVPGNRFKLLRDGVEAFPEMLDAIRIARRNIRLEVYMFIDDSVGELFARALTEAAQRGVQVTILYDWIGSFGTRAAFFRRLREQGVDVRAFKPLSFARGIGALIRRDHRKILVVDGEIAFVGGINLAAEWAPRGHGGGWRDDVMKVEGPAALMLERLFCASWRMEAHKRLYRLRRRHAGRRQRLLTRGDANAVILSSRRAIHRAYLRAIEHARESVMIANAYFLPDRKLLGALRDAARRGVRVQLILAGTSDHPIVKWAGRALYDRLLRWGVEIHEWHDGVLHSKTAVVDGAWGTVGSFNLEPMSLRFNYEANLVFSDRRWGGALARSFLEDCRRCHRIDAEAWRNRALWRRLLERGLFLFRRFL
ncbi:MAG: cardiolipin synthase ClsB [Myxococcaceae bacterium]